MKWTSAQQKVIDTKNKNILVSAAAGSGKTAVLVERIISIITDKDNPVNVDQMLICTFTKAAAAQMREKIEAAIEKLVMQNPNDVHIAKQACYIRNAQITTIDGFCTYLIRNYYDTIDLNPGCRIADDEELAVIMKEAAGNVLENWYERADAFPDDKECRDFLDCVCSISPNISDDYMEKAMMRMSIMASSHPLPYEWIDGIIKMHIPDSLTLLDEQPVIQVIFDFLECVIKDNITALTMACKLCESNGGPLAYLPAIESDIELYEQFLGVKSYEKIYEIYKTVQFERLKTIRKSEDVDESLKESVKNIRAGAKKSFESIMKKYYMMEPDRMLLVNGITSGMLVAIARLTRDYMAEYDRLKEKKKLLDFSDVEHLALKILTVDGNPDNPSETALTLSRFYHEIFVDEYQDSNDVQEAILTSIVGKNNGYPHMFMVGDVKQSIYGFRMAKPDLFLEKARAFSDVDEQDDESDNVRIDLNLNFRSRSKVLDLCNFIFRKCMTDGFGKIEYTKREELYNGAQYFEYDNDDCELLIYDTGDEDMELTSMEGELRMIARRIKELVSDENGYMVADVDEEGNQIKRRATYSDIAILFRGVNAWLEQLGSVFESEGIPVYVENTTGYFYELEVRVMLNLLRIIGNPLDDIALVSVLRSPIGRFDNEELGAIRSIDKTCFMYEALKMYEQEGQLEHLKEKIAQFMDMLEHFREYSSYMSIHELLLKVYDESGYYECVLAMSNGYKRRSNLDILAGKAKTFENTGYSGLFGFVRMMDLTTSLTVDTKTPTYKAESNSVSIMTIHKSKGLEFPIVFVAGMGKNLNKADSRETVVLHPELGIGLDYVNFEHRVRIKTLQKSVIAKKIDFDNTDEEMRVLYVALTRAKEKLIMTGSCKLKKELEKNSVLSYDEMPDTLPVTRIMNLKSYMDIVLMSLMKTDEIRRIMEENDIYIDTAGVGAVKSPAQIKVYKEEDIRDSIEENLIEDDIDSYLIRNFDTSVVYNEEARNKLISLESIKAYESDNDYKTKLSVSELKHAKMLEEEEMDEVPVRSKKEDTAQAAAKRGTLYHKFFEVLPFEDAGKYIDASKEEFSEFFNSVIAGCRQLADFGDVIKEKDIRTFLKSPLAKRMQRAAMEGTLKREQPFFMGVRADEVYEGKPHDEMILIQGIIDAFFEEDGKIILMDYKTDSTYGLEAEQIEEMFEQRYATQLNLYAQSIEKAVGKSVVEKLIYSVSSGRVIKLKD